MWLKLSDDHGDTCARARLSDAAFRTHVEGLLWTMRRETGGRIDRLDVRRFGESADAEVAVMELVQVGFWRVNGDGWLIVQAMDDQPEPDVISARRDQAADRQRKVRRRKAGVDASRRDTPRDEDSDATRDPGRGGTGRDGTGKDARNRNLCRKCETRRADRGFDLCGECSHAARVGAYAGDDGALL